MDNSFMKIVVCIKQVLDTAAEIQIQDGKIISPGSPLIMNPYDEFAVEEAVCIVLFDYFFLQTNFLSIYF